MMTRTRAGLVLLGVFLLGAASGAFATGTVLAYGFRHRGARPIEELVVRRLARRLDLDDPQREVLRKIADQARAGIGQVGSEAASKVDALLDQAYQELAPSLRPDQQKTLEKVREETKERLHRLRRLPS